MRRTYRLSALLSHVDGRHADVCDGWYKFAHKFETADELLDAVNAAPGARVPGSISRAADNVRWFGQVLATALAMARDRDAFCDARWGYPRNVDRPITPEERDRFLALWRRYADAHGLYEDSEVQS
jgi:hypothetical protein